MGSRLRRTLDNRVRSVGRRNRQPYVGIPGTQNLEAEIRPCHGSSASTRADNGVRSAAVWFIVHRLRERG